MYYVLVCSSVPYLCYSYVILIDIYFIFFSYFLHVYVLFFFFFFFSSRRRHTRCGRDWSSDVCSSDLYLFSFYADFWWFNIVPNYWCGSKSYGLPSLLKAVSFIVFIKPSHHKERAYVRSEEHTSELQSRPHLVCRLLLEKKKKKKGLNMI